jgi:opacity protein-like surface antigen
MIMRKCWLVVLAGVLWGTCSWAQSGDHVEIFGGYSYAARDFTGATLEQSTALTRGWNASLNLKFNRNVGFVSDVARYYLHFSNGNGPCLTPTGPCSTSAYTVMFGPQFSFPRTKITPFVHALLGTARAQQHGAFSNFQHNNSIAFAWGGGLDYHLIRHLALRGQADILLTHFTNADNQVHYDNFNARLSAGLVVRF